jgi:hypothetical protein
METIMEEKIRYSDQTPKEEQPPVPQASDNIKVTSGRMDDSEQAGSEKADESRRVLEEKAKDGLKNAAGRLPPDQIQERRLFANERNSRRASRYVFAVFMAAILVAGAFSFFRTDESVDRQPSPHALQQKP